MTTDPRLRLRLWVDTQLEYELWIDASNPDSLEHAEHAYERMGAITRRADREGRLWLAELYDPANLDLPYQRRGTDVRGIVDPQVAP